MVYTQEFWGSRYETKKISWHMQDVHPKLLEYLPMLVDGKTPKKFFIPLSGKTIDIPYLLSLGHQVFAIEFLAATIEEWSADHSLELKFDKDSSMYQTEDGQLKIFCGDFLNCPIEKWGPFDVIWDRAAFIAIDYSLRSQYAELLKRSVQGHDGFRFLLQTVEYDKELYAGPPQCVTDEDMKKYFKDWAAVKLLEKKLMPESHPCRNVGDRFNRVILGDPYESFFLLQSKS